MLDVEKILRESGAVLQGHFLLTSGLHSPTYMEKFRILERPETTSQLCTMIADHFRGFNVQLVAGPTMGGVILAYEVARQLGVRALFAEREGDKRVFRRGFTITPGERVLVVDDVVTTGGSVSEVIEEVKRKSGTVVGVGLLVNRGKGNVDFGVPTFGCYELSIPNYPPEKCPQCAAGIPLVKPGSSTRPLE